MSLNSTHHPTSLFRKAGPPHNFWYGHIGALAAATKNVPLGCHPHVMFSEIIRQHGLSREGVAYIDLYPARTEPMMLIINPDCAMQAVTAESPLLKHVALGEAVVVISGLDNILLKEGVEWKAMRSVFNPGFAPANLMKLVPAVVEESEIFVKVLEKAAQAGKPAPIDELCTKVTIDIIGRVVLNSQFHSQTQYCELVDAFLKVIQSSSTNKDPFNPRPYFEWARIARQKYYEIRLGRTVKAAVIAKLKDDEIYEKIQDRSKAKHVIGLAVKEYMKNEADIHNIDPKFLKVLCDNIRVFMFAGHDTTSSVLSFSFYLLSEHTEWMQKVRSEHDQVFGTNPDDAAAMIKANPVLLNQLPLTMAVIKEVLRMFPPASTLRAGNPQTRINTPTGSYPTDGAMVWVMSHAIHRDPKYFPNPNYFMPDRFLPTSPFPPIPADAWRPFERGQRNCIGQELALLESRLILALVLRKFDFEAAFGTGKGGWAEQVKPDGMERYAEGATQVLLMSAKPKDQLPLRVLRRQL